MKASGTRLSSFLITVCLATLLVATAAAGSVQSVDLNSGRRHVKVGTVEAELQGGILRVTYKADPGWKIYLTHLDIAGTASELPQNKNGNPTPGRFAYKTGHSPAVTEFRYDIDLAAEGLDGATEIFIAAHAGLFHEVDPRDKKSAWAGALDFSGRNWATYFVYVVDVNSPPVAVADYFTTNEDIVLAFDVLMNDFDPDGDVLAVIDYTQPDNGSVILNADGSGTYTPFPNYFGADSFAYTVSDGRGGEDSAAVHVEVNPVNDAPVCLGPYSFSADEDMPGIIVGTLTVEDADEGDTHILSIVEPYGLFEIVGYVLKVRDGVALDYEHQASYHLEVTAEDQHGETCSMDITVDVMNINEPPVAIEDYFETDENVTIAFDVSLNDYDPDGDTPLDYSVEDLPSHGTLTYFTIDGAAMYNPDDDYYGIDEFMYRVTDPYGAAGITVVTIQINPINSPPTDIVLSNNTVLENEVEAVIGTLAVVDPDPGDTHTLYVIMGPEFEIMGDILKLAPGVSLDYETTPSVDVVIEAQDLGGLVYREVFTINVLDVLE
jgi:hypothetical protein